MALDAVLLDDTYDIQFADNGDILTEDSLYTAILMSLFCERRADASEVPDNARRRGWIGNEATPGFEIGSKLWIYEQARITRSVLNGIADAASDGFQWLVDDGIAVSIETRALLQNGKPLLEVQMLRPSSQVDKQYFALWDATGNV